ncbi:uncharacterized protein [Nicotiana sylvestris]|uniref:uncharacterized protein n=1 Tax=Nicotiana sylvestris TaxID=4096 RepID=UPI00388CDA26
MRLAPPKKETESPVPKSGKDNKRKKASKPEDPQDKGAPTRRPRRKLIHTDLDTTHQFLDDGENEGEESTLMARTRKPTEVVKSSKSETLSREEEAPKKNVGKVPKSPEIEIIPPFPTSTLDRAGIGEYFKARTCPLVKGERLSASMLKNDNNKQEMPLQGDDVQSKANPDRGIREDVLTEPAAPSQKKTENLECLRTKAGRDKREYDELKAQADVQASAGKGALAKASSFEVQFRIASDNSSEQEYARCKSRRETLEEIHARGFDLSKEVKRARADERDAKSLLSDAEDSENEAYRP